MISWYAPQANAMAFCIALDALRMDGASVTILPDNEEAESVGTQCAVDCIGPWTNWEERRFFGSNPYEAIIAAGRAQALLR